VNFAHKRVRIDRFTPTLGTPTIVAIDDLLVRTIMREISSSVTFEIEPGETIPMMIAHSTRLAVEGAPVWVTRSNDVEDYWLSPGTSLHLRRGERLWLSVEGERSARIGFDAPLARGALVRDLLGALGQRLGMSWRAGWRAV
jgi:hypothetical protein